MSEDNPLFVTTTGDTLLDRYTRTVFPSAWIAQLNQELLPRLPGFPPINGWSLTHLFYGLTWPYLLGEQALQYHTLFELFELVAGGFLITRPLTGEEILDVLLDTLFFVAGSYYSRA